MKKYIVISIIGICVVGGICGYMFHPHSYKVVEATEATCTESGSQTYKCWCGKTYTDEVPATGHSYTEEITKEPTCTEAGEKTYKCSLCGDSYTENIKALGHDYVNNKDNIDADSCAIQVCSRCGDKIKEEHTFEYVDTETGKGYSCKNCGYNMFSITEYSEPKTMYMKDKGDYYEMPLEKSDLVVSLPQGWEVVVSGETDNGWYEIKMDGAYFYIKASLLTSTKPTQQATNKPKEDTNQQAQNSAPAQESTDSGATDAELQQAAQDLFGVSGESNWDEVGNPDGGAIGDWSGVTFE